MGTPPSLVAAGTIRKARPETQPIGTPGRLHLWSPSRVQRCNATKQRTDNLYQYMHCYVSVWWAVSGFRLCIDCCLLTLKDAAHALLCTNTIYRMHIYAYMSVLDTYYPPNILSNKNSIVSVERRSIIISCMDKDKNISWLQVFPRVTLDFERWMNSNIPPCFTPHLRH